VRPSRDRVGALPDRAERAAAERAEALARYEHGEYEHECQRINDEATLFATLGLRLAGLQLHCPPICRFQATARECRQEYDALTQSCRISAPPLFLVLCVCVGAGIRENWQKKELARELAAHKKATAQAAESAAEQQRAAAARAKLRSHNKGLYDELQHSALPMLR